jgi:hypothetical protein
MSIWPWVFDNFGNFYFYLIYVHILYFFIHIGGFHPILDTCHLRLGLSNGIKNIHACDYRRFKLTKLTLLNLYCNLYTIMFNCERNTNDSNLKVEDNNIFKLLINC